MIKYYKIAIYVLIGIVALYYLGKWRSNNIVDYNAPTEHSILYDSIIKAQDLVKKEEAAAAEKTILPFKTLNKKKVGLNSQNRATQKIMVKTESLPTQDILKNTGTSIWKNNSNYDEFTVFIYLEGMDTNYNAYCIIEFNSRKMTDFMILESGLKGTKWEDYKKDK